MQKPTEANPYIISPHPHTCPMFAWLGESYLDSAWWLSQSILIPYLHNTLCTRAKNIWMNPISNPGGLSLHPTAMYITLWLFWDTNAA